MRCLVNLLEHPDQVIDGVVQCEHVVDVYWTAELSYKPLAVAVLVAGISPAVCSLHPFCLAPFTNLLSAGVQRSCSYREGCLLVCLYGFRAVSVVTGCRSAACW